MNGNEIKTKLKQYNLQSWSRQNYINPLPVERAEGIYFWDYDGNRYADMSSQLVNMNLGFGNKAIGDAIKAKVDQYCFVGPSYGDISRAELAAKIISLMPDNFGKVFFTNAGADANENAIKIARMYTGRSKIFSRYRSYHGSSFGAGNLTGEPRRYTLEPGIPGFIKFFDPYVYREPVTFGSQQEASSYYLKKLEEQIQYEGRDQIAAIVLETITGSNGVIRGAHTFIGTTAQESATAALALGYQLESLVLGLAARDIGSVWLAGTFKRKEFARAMHIRGNLWFPAILPVGRAAAKTSTIDKMMRRVAHSDERELWRDIFTQDSFQVQLSEEAAV